MDINKAIEIPFGAKDSELKGWGFTIPEGMEARIEGNKIILEPKESEDERIRKAIISHFVSMTTSCTEEEIQRRKYIAWLEKQGEKKSADWNDADKEMSHPLYLKGFDAGREVERELNKQKPIEWDDEDENVFKILNELVEGCPAKDFYDATKEECMDWLKLLKGRIQSKQQNPIEWCDNCKLKKSVTGWKPSEDLEKASDTYAMTTPFDYPLQVSTSKKAFIAGAQWQKERDAKSAENLTRLNSLTDMEKTLNAQRQIGIREGRRLQKEEMMKNAVNATVKFFGEGEEKGVKLLSYDLDADSFRMNQRVKVIIFPSDEKE